MNIKYRLLFILIPLIVLLLIDSCTTMPKVSVGEASAQGIATNSIMEVMCLIETGTIKPQTIEITPTVPELPFYEYFNFKHTKSPANIFKGDVKLGIENSGYLRKEDPLIVFPIMDDPVETDTFTTAFDVWQFDGVEGQNIDLLVRSLSTFPTGMFLPYFLLIDDEGKILTRQAHILTLGKEKVKGLSIMVWIKDYVLPKTGNYYLVVLADNIKREDKVSFDPEIRLNDERVPLKTAFENEGWIMIGVGDSEIVEPEKQQDVYFDPETMFGAGGNITQGKYLVMLWKKE